MQHEESHNTGESRQTPQYDEASGSDGPESLRDSSGDNDDNDHKAPTHDYYPESLDQVHETTYHDDEEAPQRVDFEHPASWDSVSSIAYSVARSIAESASHYDLQDIAHDVAVKVREKFSTYRGEGHFDSRFSSWVGEIARNTTLNYLQRHPRNKETPLETTDSEGETTILPQAEKAHGPGFDEQIVERDQLNRAIKKLESSHPHEWDILKLRGEGHDYRAAAAILGMAATAATISVLRARKSRAQKRLQEFMSDEL